MIVPMKKVSVVTLKSLEQESINHLRTLGVVHVFTDPGEPESADALREQHSAIERALAAIPSEGKEDTRTGSDGAAVVDQALVIAQEVQTLLDERTQLLDERERLRREFERFVPWGDPRPDLTAKLREAGVFIRLYEVTSDLAETLLPELPHPIVLFRSKTVVRLLSVAIRDEHFPDLPMPVELPALPLFEIEDRLGAVEKRLSGIEDELKAFEPQRPLLKQAVGHLENEFQLARIGAQFSSEKELSWITGFVPEDLVPTVQNATGSYGWGLVIRDPDPDEPVPTQTRNPKAIGIIKPVFDLLGTVPGYREMDISFFFLLFFIIFFAMIIGDGGYGLIMLLGTIYAALKGKAKGRQPGPGTALMIVLSSATVIWGAVTGNWFGYEAFGDLPLLRNLVIPGIDANNDSSTEMVQYVTFVIGTIHLSIAHIWNFIRALRRKPTIAAIEQLGWLSMILGLYFLVLQLVLGSVDMSIVPRPSWWLNMIVGGLAAVMIFGKQEEGQNFFVGVGKGVANIITTALDGISAFSDIISYIRLFAVGLASLAIAVAFNEMAGGIAASMGGAGGAVVATLILFLGHTLNLAMGALSVVVHGVRLNMLEFSGHLGMEWTGVEYAPFKSR